MAKKQRQQLEPELWERQEGEGSKPWEAFVIYRDLGINRSTRQVAKQLGKSRALIERWCTAWNWVKRAEAWDTELDRIAKQEQIEEIKKMRKRHANLAKQMLDKATEALLIIPVEDIKPSDVSKLVDTAAKLERVSRGDAETVIENREGESAPSAVTFYMPDNSRDPKKENMEE